MKINLTFETDTNEDDYFNDIDQIRDIFNISKYKTAVLDIKEKLRSIIKYRKNTDDVIEQLYKFYDNELPQILRELNLGEWATQA